MQKSIDSLSTSNKDPEMRAAGEKSALRGWGETNLIDKGAGSGWHVFVAAMPFPESSGFQPQLWSSFF